MSDSCRYRGAGLVLAIMLIAGAAASATNLAGTVINGTTNRPAAGDDVVLLTLEQGSMNERGHARTDNGGRFSLLLSDLQAPHLVRVVHQGVTYHRMVPSGGKSVDIEVFEVARQMDGVAAVMDVQRLEASSDSLEVRELITMRNASSPPRTLINDRPFQIQLPPEAEVEFGMAQAPGGQPVERTPTPGDRKGQYYFMVPLRPGDTRFLITYKLPYNGEVVLEPQLLNPLESFTVMLPRSMKFMPRAEGVFHAMPGISKDNVQGTAPVQPGQRLAYRISGTGTLAELEGIERQAQNGAVKPGGGLGAPIGSPDPLHDSRWFLLTGLSMVLAGGGVYITRKRCEVAQPKIPAAGRRMVRRDGRRKRSQPVFRDCSG